MPFLRERLARDSLVGRLLNNVRWNLECDPPTRPRAISRIGSRYSADALSTFITFILLALSIPTAIFGKLLSHCCSKLIVHYIPIIFGLCLMIKEQIILQLLLLLYK